MRIKKLRLKNGYKRFHDLTIDLGDEPARIVALVGPNGCGKSSVLDGLLFHAARLRSARNPHIALSRYHAFMRATAAFREALYENAAQMDDEINRQIDMRRGK